MPACGRLEAKYSRTVPGQLDGEDMGQPPSGLPTYFVPEDEVTITIVAVSVLLVVRLAVKPLVNRLAKPVGVAVASGSRNSTPPVGIVSV